MAGDSENRMQERESAIDLESFKFEDITLPQSEERRLSPETLVKESSVKVNAQYNGEPIVVQLSRGEIFTNERRTLVMFDFEIFKTGETNPAVEVGVNITEKKAKCTMYLKKTVKNELAGMGRLLYAEVLDYMQSAADWLGSSFTDYAKHDPEMGLTKEQWTPMFQGLLEGRGYKQVEQADETSAGEWRKHYAPEQKKL